MAFPDLTDQFIADTYKGILHTANVPATNGNLPVVFDGLGNRTSLSVDNNGIKINDLNLTTFLDLINLMFPVGSIYMSYDDNNPQNRFVGTTWIKVSEGRFIVGAGTGNDGERSTFFSVGDNYNGRYLHTLTINEMPTHNHIVNGGRENFGRTNSSDKDVVGFDPNKQQGNTTFAGGNQPHNNIPPGYGVYVWRRTI